MNLRSVTPKNLPDIIPCGEPADVSANARIGSVILCLTRDRPRTLVHALRGVSVDLKKAKSCPRALILLDDSVKVRSRLQNLHIIESIAKAAKCVCLYHGPAEQQKVLAFLRMRGSPDTPAFDLFFRRLGGLKWDLGGVRSYAMVLANLIGEPSSPVVMIDDDIVILPQARGASAIGRLEEEVLTNPRLLTGGLIKGSPDESSVETAIRGIRQFTRSNNRFLPAEMPMPISGGFIAFNSMCSSLYPFPRWYNEDWTWLAQCKAQGCVIRVDRRVAAKQIFSPKKLSQATMQREQEGELLFEALNWAIRNYNPRYVRRALKSPAYWEDVAREEVIYLDKIMEFMRNIEDRLFAPKLQRAGFPSILRLVKRTRSYVASIEAKAMMRKYRLYLEAAKPWRSLIKTARQGKMDFAAMGRKV